MDNAETLPNEGSRASRFISVICVEVGNASGAAIAASLSYVLTENRSIAAKMIAALIRAPMDHCFHSPLRDYAGVIGVREVGIALASKPSGSPELRNQDLAVM